MNYHKAFLCTRQLGLSIIVGCICLVFHETVRAGIVTYIDNKVGQTFQKAQETYFLEDVNDPNIAFINFDDVDAGQIDGNEWSHVGVSFSQPEGGLLGLLTEDSWSTPQTLPNGLWPISAGKESIEILFNKPTTTVGFWVIDTEYNTVGNDCIKFYDSSDNLLISMLLPFTNYNTQDTDGNFFIGVISGTPIARILLHEQPDDNDGIGLDNLYFGDSNSQPCFKPLGDLNLDCRVDFFDLSLLAARWLLDCKSSPGDPLCNPN